MSEWLDGYIADSELVETIVETLESFDKEDDEACSHRISSLQYSLIRQMIGKWHNLSAEFPEMADSYSNECLGRIFNVCLYGNWSDWRRLLKGYSPVLDHESHRCQEQQGASVYYRCPVCARRILQPFESRFHQEQPLKRAVACLRS